MVLPPGCCVVQARAREQGRPLSRKGNAARGRPLFFSAHQGEGLAPGEMMMFRRGDAWP
ncbi:hypothetical protein DA2_2482 [Desulfovibrio sp. A2]|nr:hypothetical protein DA2_2482 [Desulfovibrio sp. A2]